MRLESADAVIALDDADITAVRESLRTEAETVPRFAVVESAMFRILKGLVPPYLHAAQRTVVREWVAAGSPVAVRVSEGVDERGRGIVACVLSAAGVQCVEQVATLHWAQPASSSTSHTPRQPSAAPKLGAELDRWTPTGDEMLAYSGWGHPNSHTDDAFARSIGLTARVVQGSMLQNRLLTVLVERGLSPPFTITTTFRRPVAMGDEVGAWALADDPSTYVIGTESAPASIRMEVVVR